jgi:hypothetical protein
MSVDDAPAGGTLDYAWRRGGQRPLTVKEHVAFAVEGGLSVVLEIRRGPIEVGRLDLVCGELVHAELPGTAGDLALRLLGRLGPVEIDVATRASDGPRTVTRGSRALVPAASLDHGARAQLEAAYAPILAYAAAAAAAPATPSAAPEPSRAPSPEPASAPAGEDFDAVFVEGMRAYARRDYRGALERFERCARLRPDDARVTHNIERLRRRLEAP